MSKFDFSKMSFATEAAKKLQDDGIPPIRVSAQQLQAMYARRGTPAEEQAKQTDFPEDRESMKKRMLDGQATLLAGAKSLKESLDFDVYVYDVQMQRVAPVVERLRRIMQEELASVGFELCDMSTLAARAQNFIAADRKPTGIHLERAALASRLIAFNIPAMAGPTDAMLDELRVRYDGVKDTYPPAPKTFDELDAMVAELRGPDPENPPQITHELHMKLALCQYVGARLEMIDMYEAGADALSYLSRGDAAGANTFTQILRENGPDMADLLAEYLPGPLQHMPQLPGIGQVVRKAPGEPSVLLQTQV